MKQSMFSKQGQKGFTLLELLIVVTIIAILSVGAILAYDGLTDKAQSATAANNTITADQSIRNYRAVTGNYPNQWDHLVVEDATGGPLEFVSEDTYFNLAQIDSSTLGAGVSAAIAEAFEEVGITELQFRATSEATAGVEPNLQHNEGATGGVSEELEIEDTFPAFLAVVPTANSGNAALCGGAVALSDDDDSPAVIAAGGDLTPAIRYMNKINDRLGEGNCHLIVAFGFGHDAAHSTAESNVAIAAAPAYVSNDINPAINYARYIALFDLGEDDDGDGVFEDEDIRTKAVLVGVIDPEGNVIDENVAAANDEGPVGEDDD